MTEIKICGITRLEDAFSAADCGADAVGFIFHEPSPRWIDPIQAKAIVEALAGQVTTVGVFVNRKAEDVERIAEACGLDLIQFHGDETAEYCRRFSPERVIKAVWLRNPEDLQRLEDYDVRAFLADARDAGRYGGTGKRADWELAASLAGKHPLILAGGLGEGNIEEALAAVSPLAVDINSGCEKKPGIKDPERIRRIVAIVRRAGPPGPGEIFSTLGNGKTEKLPSHRGQGK